MAVQAGEFGSLFELKSVWIKAPVSTSDNDLVKSLKAHHSTKGRGVVLLQNGHKFRKFILSQ